jgi:PKD repeat protein
MKKKIVSSFLAVLVFSQLFAQDIKPCSTDELNEQYKNEHPEERAAILKAEQDLLKHAAAYEKNGDKSGSTVYTIPIVFHVLHQGGSENISDAQVYDAVRVINEDFRKLNSDTNLIVPAFRGIAADMKIQVALAKLDPDGNCTNGIDRIFTDETNQGTDRSKLNQWPRDKYLNIWVVKRISSGAAGYAYYPASTVFRPQIDGIVVLNDYVGSIGTSSQGRARTVTHEIGHYLNLPHLWGSTNDPGLQSNCNTDDGISDTPNSIGWQSCNLQGTSCGSLDNVQNYMEYSYCSRMFTQGQATRMRATLTSSVAFRNNLWSPANLAATGVSLPDVLCKADFEIGETYACTGDTVIFSDLSYTNPTTWMWQIPGATPSSSFIQNPTVIFNQAGVFGASLTVFNGGVSKSVTKNNLIRVFSTTADTVTESFVESFENQAYLDNKWLFLNDFGGGKFEVSSTAAVSGNNSLYFDNINYSRDNQEVAIISPSFDLSALSNPKLKFSFAYATKGMTSNDEFNIYSSIDCGKTWNPRFGLVGNTMSTAPSSNSSFTPQGPNEWNSFTLPLSAVTNFDNVRFKFEFVGNQGNNFYLDNINITGTLVGLASASLMDETVSLFPNPTQSDHTVLQFELNAPVSQMNLNVLDIRGKLMNKLELSNLNVGINQIVIPTSSLLPGLYIVNINIDSHQLNKKLLVK